MTDDRRNIHEQLNFFDLKGDLSRPFADIAKAVDRHASGALDSFYAKAAATPAAARHFASPQQMQGASDKQLAHWRQLFTQSINDAYVARAVKIGEIHGRIKLDPALYFGAYSQILGRMVEGMILGSALGKLPGSKRLADSVAVLVKTALLDMSISVGTIFEVKENEQREVIDKIGVTLEQIAGGNLTADVPALPPAYAQLSEHCHQTMHGLSEALHAVTLAAASIRTGSAEISVASDDLARRTEQQAASLEETAAAMDQMTGSVRDTAKSTAEVHQQVSATQSDAENGGLVVRDAVKAMEEIERSSRQIANIITVIDGIAFQTNLLALNAGVEAARAGDAGKGFAVVASEVRALAQRSADAAKDIKELITLSWHQVETGVKLVGQTGESLERIVERIAEVSNMVAGIARSTEEQANGLLQVNIVVTDMDKMTQQNAAMVEQSTAASRSLADEAEKLSTLVEKFEINSQPQSQQAAATRPAPAKRPAPQIRGNLALADDLEWTDF